jgi:uncharacterized protein YheU (UPF0270 family)
MVTWGTLLQIVYRNLENPLEAKIVRDNTDIWIYSLPIDFDAEEAKRQYGFLLYLIKNFFDYLAGPGMKDLGHLMTLIVQFYKSPKSSDQLDQEIESIFESISKVEAVKIKLSEIHNTLNAQDKIKMEKCLSKALE